MEKTACMRPKNRMQAFVKVDGQMGFCFDIFQLGLLLWYLYGDHSQQAALIFGLLAGCSNAELGTCDEAREPIYFVKACGRYSGLCRFDHRFVPPKGSAQESRGVGVGSEVPGRRGDPQTD